MFDKRKGEINKCKIIERILHAAGELLHEIHIYEQGDCIFVCICMDLYVCVCVSCRERMIYIYKYWFDLIDIKNTTIDGCI